VFKLKLLPKVKRLQANDEICPLYSTNKIGIQYLIDLVCKPQDLPDEMMTISRLPSSMAARTA